MYLKADAIPSIFDFPERLKKISKTRKLPKKRSFDEALAQPQSVENKLVSPPYPDL